MKRARFAPSLIAGLLFLAAAGGLATDAAAGPAPATNQEDDVPMPGQFETWSGRYTCAQGVTGMTLMIKELSDQRLSALFYFFPVPENPTVPQGCYTMEGEFDRASGSFILFGRNWIMRPPNYVVVDLVGRIAGDRSRITGTVDGPLCTTFDVTRGVTRAAAPNCDALIARAAGPSIAE